MEAMVLIYGVEGTALRRLKTLLAQKNVRARRVRPEEYGEPVGAFCGQCRKHGADGENSPEIGAMLVFCSCSTRQLDMLLAELRTARLCLDARKAVLTEHNAAWSGRALYAELSREHERLERAETEQDGE